MERKTDTGVVYSCTQCGWSTEHQCAHVIAPATKAIEESREICQRIESGVHELSMLIESLIQRGAARNDTQTPPPISSIPTVMTRRPQDISYQSGSAMPDNYGIWPHKKST